MHPLPFKRGKPLFKVRVRNHPAQDRQNVREAAGVLDLDDAGPRVPEQPRDLMLNVPHGFQLRPIAASRLMGGIRRNAGALGICDLFH